MRKVLQSKASPAKTSPAKAAQDRAVDAAVNQFLKTIDHAARREIEKRLRKAITEGKLKAGDSITTGMGLKSPDVDIDVTVYGKINL